jgi:hypothetical protein
LVPDLFDIASCTGLTIASATAGAGGVLITSASTGLDVDSLPSGLGRSTDRGKHISTFEPAKQRLRRWHNDKSTQRHDEETTNNETHSNNDDANKETCGTEDEMPGMMPPGEHPVSGTAAATSTV